MNSDFMKHIWYYCVSFVVASVCILLLFLVQGDKNMQIVIVLGLTLFYITWGLLHHAIHHNIPLKIVIEYVLIGSLGFILSLFLFNF